MHVLRGAVVLVLVLLAFDASAQAPPAQRLQRPSSVEGYERLRRELKTELRRAQREDRDDVAELVRRDTDTVDDWYREDVERQSGGAFAVGIVMTSLGGLSLVSGLGLLIAAEATEAAGTDRDISNGLDVASTATLLSGVGLLGAGIPLTVWGGQRVMADDYARAPRGEVMVGAGGVRLDVTF